MNVSLPISIVISLVLSLLVNSERLVGQATNYRFDHLTIDDGLSQNLVYTITQDYRGFMWFGTHDGLNRFDGIEFTSYYHSANDTFTILDNLITKVVEDSRKQLWVGAGGLNHYDRSYDRFQRILAPSDFPGMNSDAKIKEIEEDHNGDLWIGFEDNGLYLISFIDTTIWSQPSITVDDIRGSLAVLGPYIYSNTKDSRYRSIKKILSVQNSIWISHGAGVNRLESSKGIFPFPTSAVFEDIIYDKPGSRKEYGSMLCDDQGSIWIGTSEGLLSVPDPEEPDNLKISNYPRQRSDYNWWSIPRSMTLAADRKLWIATYRGVNIFDLEKLDFSRIEHDPNEPGSISHDGTTDVFLDKGGIIWLGTSGMGLNKSSSNAKPFNILSCEVPDHSFFSAYGLVEDNTHSLWVTFNDGLLCKFDRKSNNDLVLSKSYSGYDVSSLTLDQNGQVWFVSRNLLINIESFSQALQSYQLFPLSTNKLSSDSIPSIYVDENNHLWACNSSALYKIDRQSQRVDELILPFQELGKITNILKDKKQRFWIASERGLLRFDPITYDYKLYHSKSEEGLRLPNDFINSLLLDPLQPEKFLWIGSAGGGLFKLDLDQDTIEIFRTEQGLSNNYVYGILSDDDGHLWVSTNNGLSKLDKTRRQFRRYSFKDGLQSNEFNSRSYFKSQSGEIFFGGVKGISAFFPEKIRDNPHQPPVAITDFYLSYNATSWDEKNSPISQSILETDQIDLPYDERDVAFKFAALDFSHPDENQYRYRLEGFDRDWIYAGSRNEANYTNLPAGNFVFRVQGSNNDGLFSDPGAKVKLSIARAPWLRWWAILGYILIVGTTGYYIYRYFSDKKRLLLSLHEKHLEAQRIRELDEFKSKFFTNISHEFRTPLTLINGQLDQMMSKVEESDLRNAIVSTKNNADKILLLIEQLLDIAKVESNQLKLYMSTGDIVSFMQRLLRSMEPIAMEKKIEIIFQSDRDSWLFDFDADAVHKIFQNLISNAIKFSPIGGRIWVDLKRIQTQESDGRSQEWVVIEVKDEGPGVPDGARELIFDRFYQVASGSARNAGFGIGLALAKELTFLHGGKISLESRPNVGATFRSQLPATQKPQRPIVNQNLLEKLDRSNLVSPLPKKNQQKIFRDPISVLIVEDHDELRTYIQNILEEDYEILVASDGKVAMELTRKHLPDLIVSDIMMPDLDGYELATQIISDQLTSHIPILFLTAKASSEDRLKGLEIGVDDYITKPFQAEELKLRIRNLIKKRETLKAKYSSAFIENFSTRAEEFEGNLEENFLKQIQGFIESNLEDDNFGVEKLAELAGMSTSNLNRKIQGITQMSPGQLIQRVRIETAIYLLKQGYNISEVAFQTGFRTPSYFTQVFKRIYSTTPRAFIKQHL